MLKKLLELLSPRLLSPRLSSIGPQRHGPIWRRSLLLGAVMLLSSPLALAVAVPDLLRADVLVVGQGGSAREAGFRQAMEIVLIKLSGNAAVADYPGMGAHLRGASRHVQQYRYRALEPLLEADPPAESESGFALPVPTHVLEVEFAEASLLRVLETLGIPVWGRDRPQILLWVAVSANTGRYLVGGDGHDGIAAHLQNHAQLRGVPILLPLLDVEDQAAVEFADVRGGFHERLLRAAQRYGVDRILIAYLEQVRGGQWQANWTLYSEGDAVAWNSQALDPERLVAKGMDGLAGQLASLYAVRRSAAVNRLRLRVEDVRALEDYGRITQFLQSLALTRKVQLRRVSAEALEFLLEVQGERPDLERALALSPSLYARDSGLQQLFLDDDAATTDVEPVLFYRYRP